jgi:hypothetical protein
VRQHDEQRLVLHAEHVLLGVGSKQNNIELPGQKMSRDSRNVGRYRRTMLAMFREERGEEGGGRRDGIEQREERR